MTANLSDAVVAIRKSHNVASRLTPGRIGHLLQSEETPSDLNIVTHSKYAIDAKGSYTFEGGVEHEATEDPTTEKGENLAPFSLEDIRLKLPRGAQKIWLISLLMLTPGGLTCLIGRVGTGKSALLQGLLGEMRQTTGRTVFSGPISYGTHRVEAGSR